MKGAGLKGGKDSGPRRIQHDAFTEDLHFDGDLRFKYWGERIRRSVQRILCPNGISSLEP